MFVNENKKKYCCKCRVKSTGFFHLNGKKCKDNESCYGWHSTEHHTLFCPERIKEFNFFLPHIDQVLLPRFFEILDMDEKYSTILSSKDNEKIYNLEPIKIHDSLKLNDYRSTNVLNIVVHSIVLNGLNITREKMLFDSIALKSLICIPRRVHIENSNFTPEMIFQLLSKYTKTFFLYNSFVSPNLLFSDIFKMAPNLESVTITGDRKSITYGKTWIEDPLKYKLGNNFNYLNIDFLTVEEFNIESLIKFIKIKCAKNVKIAFSYGPRLHLNNNEKAKFDQLKQDLLKYFNLIDKSENLREENIPHMIIDSSNGDTTFSLENIHET